MKRASLLKIFRKAVNSMATSDLDLRERIYEAFPLFGSLRPEDIEDPDVRELFADFLRRLTARGTLGTKKGLIATVQYMTPEGQRKAAEQIVRIRDMLESRRRRSKKA